jgi:cephalosporin hydroxylase
LSRISIDFNRMHQESQAWELLPIQKPTELLALMGFLSAIRPHHVIEIGTMLGGMLYAFCNVATGKKISVDLVGQPGSVLRSTDGREYKSSPEKYHRLSALDPQVILIEGDSHDKRTRRRVELALGGDRADFLLIDGDHSAEGSWKDYEDYKGFVQPGGWIAFHDIVDSPKHRRTECRVDQTWSRVVKMHKNIVEILSGDQGEELWGGIGLAQKE